MREKKKFDWEDFKKQRAEVTREVELELAKEIGAFLRRFLCAKLQGKKVVKKWWTDDEGGKLFDLCTKTDIKLPKDVRCMGCLEVIKAEKK